eukprot:COSAG03_NODE_680_length_6345_cov_66.753122_6_plen_65_part_00
MPRAAIPRARAIVVMGAGSGIAPRQFPVHARSMLVARRTPELASVPRTQDFVRYLPTRLPAQLT